MNKIEADNYAYYGQRNNMAYAVPLVPMILRQSSPHLLTELRLELTLTESRDVGLLSQVASGAVGLRRLALDFVRATDEAIQNIPTDAALPMVHLKTFAFQFHYCKYTVNSPH